MAKRKPASDSLEPMLRPVEEILAELEAEEKAHPTSTTADSTDDWEAHPVYPWEAWLKKKAEDPHLGKAPPRVKIEVTLAPETISGLDEIGKSFGDSRRGRNIDKIVAHYLAGQKAKPKPK